jgi:hypothetical protein
MLGIKHIKFDSMSYVIHFIKGKIKAQGRGLSFFYFAPNSSIVAIPMGSNNLPFIFNESTQDYQTVSIQGQISYKISNPNLLADVLDFTVKDNGQYKVNDIEKLNQRIINAAQTSTSTLIHDIKLKDSIRSAKQIEQSIVEGFESSQMIETFGIEVIGVNVLAVSATPEMLRALETETREQLQQEADQAIYVRRNFAVEQERIIKETELNTEIAVEEKRKQISQKKMESSVLKSQNERRLKEMNLETDIAIENQKKVLLEQKTDNDKKQADTDGYVLETTLKPYKDLDWKLLTALNNNTDPKFNISLAFRELAGNADKIGNLNMSPDLLESILNTNNNVQK